MFHKSLDSCLPYWPVAEIWCACASVDLFPSACSQGKSLLLANTNVLVNKKLRKKLHGSDKTEEQLRQTTRSLRYHRGITQHTMSVEILSNSAQIYEKTHLEGFQYVNDLEGHSRSSELPQFDRQYITSDPIFYQNYCIDCDQILHSDKDHQMPFVGGPAWHTHTKSKMADGRHLGRIVISRPRFEQFCPNLAGRCSSTLLTN